MALYKTMSLTSKAIGLFSHNVYYVKLELPYNKFMGL